MLSSHNSQLLIGNQGDNKQRVSIEVSWEVEMSLSALTQYYYVVWNYSVSSTPLVQKPPKYLIILNSPKYVQICTPL